MDAVPVQGRSGPAGQESPSLLSTQRHHHGLERFLDTATQPSGQTTTRSHPPQPLLRRPVTLPSASSRTQLRTSGPTSLTPNLPRPQHLPLPAPSSHPKPPLPQYLAPSPPSAQHPHTTTLSQQPSRQPQPTPPTTNAVDQALATAVLTALTFLRNCTNVQPRADVPPWVLAPHLAAARYEQTPHDQLTATAVSAKAVQREHARRTARTVVDFATFMATPPPSRRTWLAAQALTEYLHHRCSRRTVTVPVLTARPLLHMLGQVVQTEVTGSPTVRAFMTGLERLAGANPMPQPAADPQTLAALIAELERAATTHPIRRVLTVVHLMSAALRTPEAILTMQRGRLAVAERGSDRTTIEVIPWGLKDDKGKAIVNPQERVLVIPNRSADAMQRVWGTLLSEVAAEELDKEVRRVVHAAGIPDVRMLRRLAARTTWQVMDNDSGRKAVDLVRRVLGHRDNSESTFRYIQSRTNATIRRSLTEAARARTKTRTAATSSQ